MTTLAALQSLIEKGESETLELKRSSAELKRAGETLCAFLNGEGGEVLIGVAPAGIGDFPTGKRAELLTQESTRGGDEDGEAVSGPCVGESATVSGAAHREATCRTWRS